ncbi:DUF4149 domain-containing protein [Alloacidobacterium dinghuense]|uniref:DUF4149 domain-containing protein n=1 Tax=Alloacidobacterium dinghuense TaxID=2763107 RepID=A0A7G8BCH2_9BACT|nr:DUF4149 domain-containing protein [Alloacidobacterium dinghuense]QNI30242.1 DUF4149 domain-containing protein [Alloacidobacterium dinghuense]
MKTLLRALILLLIVLWLGGVMFFPVVAASAFSSIADTHVAGTVVRKCLLVLHYEGLFSGAMLIILLLAAARFRAYARSVTLPLLFALIMLVLTAFSQYWIIPRMEGFRLAAGGAIDAVSANDPNRVAFNKLHAVSEHVEEGVLLAGIVLVALVARD